ncbi:MAG: TatD family hydrolase [Candidatus Hydrogenedentes bacterium]|nr:TatD family hydrolase [Candidatus Hydrogenedentota bacterium]
MVDTHCHLQDAAFDGDRPIVLERALNCLSWFIVVGDDLESSRRACELARERVYASVGLHPYHADSVSEPAIASLADLARSPYVVAIGEIGLDYYHGQAPRDIQQQALEKQLELAVRLGRPVVIHNRDADDDLLRVLEGFHGRLPGGAMHCFSGEVAFAKACLHLGFYISFAGNVTFPKAGALREAARAVPLDRLLVETDSPYLAPQPVRGKRCEPAYVRHTAEALAAIKGCSLEEFGSATSANARRLFLSRDNH